MADEAILSELKEIRRDLSILAIVAFRPALSRFERDVLRTDNRIRIFRAFDGKRTPTDVGKLAGVTGQGVRDLIKDLEPKGFVEIPSSGSQVASVKHDVILDWYHATSA